jgi:hypothetical protein
MFVLIPVLIAIYSIILSNTENTSSIFYDPLPIGWYKEDTQFEFQQRNRGS